MPLPVEKILPEIKKAFQEFRSVVLQAPPGAGKTTRVPLFLLEEPWLKGKKILLLEPRRLAARTCAAHMASIIKEPLGRTIGYRVRMEKKVSPETRLEVITQGVFVRKIQNDPGLEDTGLVIFDEFHERNLQSDLGFALCMDALDAFCDHLRVLVMSATMDTGAVSALMGDVPVITSSGRQYNVKTIYQKALEWNRHKVSMPRRCVRVIVQAVKTADKDILVFLPGAGEIQKVFSLLEQEALSGVEIMPLYGNLSHDQQSRVFLPLKQGRRKIVLATSIAETSLTIDGIGAVVDAGLMRLPRFSPKSGMTRLETVTVSKAAADQRRGRAGRISNGTCYRMWSEYEHGLLKPFTSPEILNADLCALGLELAAWGVSEPAQLKWLDLPDPAFFDQAKELLISLGAVDIAGQITPHGKQMVRAGLHPRLSHMIIKGEAKGLGYHACLVAALLEEQDIIRNDQEFYDPDFRLRLEILQAALRREKGWQKKSRVKEKVVRKILKTCKKIAGSFNIKALSGRDNDVCENSSGLLALAYPDRVAKKRKNSENNFLMASGKGAYFPAYNSISGSEYIVALHLDGKEKKSKIFLAAPISEQEIEDEFGSEFKSLNQLSWDERRNAVAAKRQTKFKNIVIREKRLSEIDPEHGADLLLEQVRKKGLGVLPWTKKAAGFRDRVVFLRRHERYSSLPDLSDTALEDKLDSWLKPFLTGIFSFKKLEQMDFNSAFFSMLTWDEQQRVEKNAPTHIVVPSGSKCPLQYRSQGLVLESPVLKVRLQEIFSMICSPEVAGVRVTIHILSPASRPVQITDDLESFWQNTYKDVKKDLMGRYPKHYWPEDPFKAIPTSRVRPEKQ